MILLTQKKNEVLKNDIINSEKEWSLKKGTIKHTRKMTWKKDGILKNDNINTKKHEKFKEGYDKTHTRKKEMKKKQIWREKKNTMIS